MPFFCLALWNLMFQIARAASHFDAVAKCAEAGQRGRPPLKSYRQSGGRCMCL